MLSVIKTSEGANWAYEQSKELINRGIDVVTVIPDTEGKVARKYIENEMKIIVQDCSIPTKNPFNIFQRIKKIREIVNKEKPDIIHTHFVTNILMLRLALKKDKTKRIFQVPGPLHLENKFFKWIDYKTSNNEDYWIATCKKTYEIYKTFKKKDIDKHIFLNYYGGYGGNTVEEYSKDTNILHKQFGLSTDYILIGMVSYFYKPKRYLGQKRGLKGHEDFIDAISILSKQNPKIIGIIIGGAWKRLRKI